MKSFLEARRFCVVHRHGFSRTLLASCLCGGLLLFLGSDLARSQSISSQASTPAAATPPESTQAESKQNSAEITAHDEPTTFKVNVKLVVVRVVVRDARGHAIGNLHKEDFQIFDRGKPQLISQFEVEQPGDLTAKARQTAEASPSDAVPVSDPSPAAVPERFVAYLFDDVHLQFGDLAHVRDAAERQFASLRPTDRAAIFTTSGQNNLNFTDDRAKLHEALFRLMPRPIAGGESQNDCPQISYYQADLIVNKTDSLASSVALQEAMTCPQVATAPPPMQAQLAAALVNATTPRILDVGEHESHVSLAVLKQAVRSLAHMPGQRSIVILSPGFITPQLEFEYTDILDLAVRSQIIINTLDARGLYTIDAIGDISSQAVAAPPPQKAMLLINAAIADEDILALLADGTGGVFFHNSNDYDEGFRRTAQAPEYSYVLAFTPPDLKLDGNFHPLKVTLKNPQKLTVQARRGYFAPKHLTDANEQAKQEIEDALYSQDELHNLPVKLHTQFFKASDDAAKLVVLAHVDVQRMHFRKADGRNSDVLTCVSAVFNRNGNFLQGLEKTVTMHWKDETLQNKLGSGITLKSSFDVKPGSYLVRLVVRDSEGQLMSAENGTVEIR
jgi:VWFA-related protein